MPPARSGAEKKRCAWARNPFAVAYHDREWGVPARDDRKLFELLILEGAQAGLSWDTILAKRENYRRAFDRFDPRKVARYGAAKKRRLLADAGIVRNRAKIDAAVTNARAFLDVQKEFGTFSRYVWGFTGGKPLQGRRRALKDIPASSRESDALSKDLKRRGFKFVGTTIMYAFMQAVGMVNDHTRDCFRHRALAR
ncbi:MAG TPA: DNA-3-methyladenine glycosylase I [Burkholderiales bacterium]|nr:DNA-3-methyladenine glycosylase I [Burkholderiales bacterium]